MKLIIDTDFGDDIDDTFALGYLIRKKKEGISLVLSDYGDTFKRAELICGFLERCDAAQVEVAAGMHMAFRDPYQYIFKEQHPKVKRYDPDGIETACRIISESNDTVVFIALGPAVNLFEILRRIPEHAHKLKVYGMFGSVYTGYFGNTIPDREYNVMVAEDEFRYVIENVSDLTITPLDTCGEIILADDRYERLLKSENIVAQTVIADYFRWKTLGFCEILEKQTSVLYDTVAAYMALDGNLLEYEKIRLSVEEGRTLNRENGIPVNVALHWRNKEKFLDELSAAFC